MIIGMLFGFALVCSANLLCFYPQTLMHVAPDLYRLYNLAACLAIVGGSLLGALLSLSSFGKPVKAMLVGGYLSLAVGMASSLFIGEGNGALVVVSGVFCGLGVAFLMICWFSFLALLPERLAMLTQGGQALLGSLLFVVVSQVFLHYSSLAALLCLVVSAVLAVTMYRHSVMPNSSSLNSSALNSSALNSDVPVPTGGAPNSGMPTSSSLKANLNVAPSQTGTRADAADKALPTSTSLRANLGMLLKKGSLGSSFTFSLFAFVIISLLFGVITAVIMSPNSSTNAMDQSTVGGIIGAAVFLLWAAFSKKRDYGFMIKAFFGVFAFVLILPIEGHGLITAMGYQLICLLFFSLVIDTFSPHKRTLLCILSLSFALTRGMFLLGLYIPGRFGVLSYADFFSSASLLFFIVYLVFIVIVFVFAREKKLASDQPSFLLSETVTTDVAHKSVQLGKKHGLTKRETEVLGLLARGRDAAYICKELYLSRNTVKSYMKSIYAKLGVHSHQELIDLIEEMR